MKNKYLITFKNEFDEMGSVIHSGVSLVEALSSFILDIDERHELPGTIRYGLSPIDELVRYVNNMLLGDDIEIVVVVNLITQTIPYQDQDL